MFLICILFQIFQKEEHKKQRPRGALHLAVSTFFVTFICSFLYMFSLSFLNWYLISKIEILEKINAI